MLKKAIVVIITLIALSLSLYSAPVNQGASNKFPWLRKWDRHHLYRMAIFYYEAGDAYEKKGKSEKAKYCYKHANNVSPYSDVGAKARNKLRAKYSQTPKEPTVGEMVTWLEKQPDLTAGEKAFIKAYKTRGQNQGSTPDTAVPSQGSTSSESTEPGTGTSSPSGQGGSQSGSPATTSQQPSNEQNQSGEGITDEEIRNRGSRLDYRDDSSTGGN